MAYCGHFVDVINRINFSEAREDAIKQYFYKHVFNDLTFKRKELNKKLEELRSYDPAKFPEFRQKSLEEQKQDCESAILSIDRYLAMIPKFDDALIESMPQDLLVRFSEKFRDLSHLAYAFSDAPSEVKKHQTELYLNVLSKLSKEDQEKQIASLSYEAITDLITQAVPTFNNKEFESLKDKCQKIVEIALFEQVKRQCEKAKFPMSHTQYMDFMLRLKMEVVDVGDSSVLDDFSHYRNSANQSISDLLSPIIDSQKHTTWDEKSIESAIGTREIFDRFRFGQHERRHYVKKLEDNLVRDLFWARNIRDIEAFMVNGEADRALELVKINRYVSQKSKVDTFDFRKAYYKWSMKKDSSVDVFRYRFAEKLEHFFQRDFLKSESAQKIGKLREYYQSQQFLILYEESKRIYEAWEQDPDKQRKKSAPTYPPGVPDFKNVTTNSQMIAAKSRVEHYNLEMAKNPSSVLSPAQFKALIQEELNKQLHEPLLRKFPDGQLELTVYEFKEELLEKLEAMLMNPPKNVSNYNPDTLALTLLTEALADSNAIKTHSITGTFYSDIDMQISQNPGRWVKLKPGIDWLKNKMTQEDPASIKSLDLNNNNELLLCKILELYDLAEYLKKESPEKKGPFTQGENKLIIDSLGKLTGVFDCLNSAQYNRVFQIPDVAERVEEVYRDIIFVHQSDKYLMANLLNLFELSNELDRLPTESKKSASPRVGTGSARAGKGFGTPRTTRGALDQSVNHSINDAMKQKLQPLADAFKRLSSKDSLTAFGDPELLQLAKQVSQEIATQCQQHGQAGKLGFGQPHFQKFAEKQLQIEHESVIYSQEKLDALVKRAKMLQTSTKEKKQKSAELEAVLSSTEKGETRVKEITDIYMAEYISMYGTLGMEYYKPGQEYSNKELMGDVFSMHRYIRSMAQNIVRLQERTRAGKPALEPAEINQYFSVVRQIANQLPPNVRMRDIQFEVNHSLTGEQKIQLAGLDGQPLLGADGKVLSFSINTGNQGLPYSLIKLAGSDDVIFSYGGSRGLVAPFSTLDPDFVKRHPDMLELFSNYQLRGVGQYGSVQQVESLLTGLNQVIKEGNVSTEHAAEELMALRQDLRTRGTTSKDAPLSRLEGSILKARTRALQSNQREDVFYSERVVNMGGKQKVVFRILMPIAPGESLQDVASRRLVGFVKADSRYHNPWFQQGTEKDESQEGHGLLEDDLLFAGELVAASKKIIEDLKFTHNDIKPENFHFRRNQDGSYEVTFIDWETGGFSEKYKGEVQDRSLSEIYQEVFEMTADQNPQSRDGLELLRGPNGRYIMKKDGKIEFGVVPQLDILGKSSHGTLPYISPRVLYNQDGSLRNRKTLTPVEGSFMDDWALTVLSFGICNRSAYFQLVKGRIVADYEVPGILERDGLDPEGLKIVNADEFNRRFACGGASFIEEQEDPVKRRDAVMYVPSNQREGEPLHNFRRLELILQKLDHEKKSRALNHDEEQTFKDINTVLGRVYSAVSKGEGLSKSVLEETIALAKKSVSAYSNLHSTVYQQQLSKHDALERVFAKYHSLSAAVNLSGFLGVAANSEAREIDVLCLYPSTEQERNSAIALLKKANMNEADFYTKCFSNESAPLRAIFKDCIKNNQPEIMIELLSHTVNKTHKDEWLRFFKEQGLFHYALEQGMTDVVEKIVDVLKQNGCTKEEIFGLMMDVYGHDQSQGQISNQSHIQWKANAMYAAIRSNNRAALETILKWLTPGNQYDRQIYEALHFCAELQNSALFRMVLEAYNQINTNRPITTEALLSDACQLPPDNSSPYHLFLMKASSSSETLAEFNKPENKKLAREFLLSTGAQKNFPLLTAARAKNAAAVDELFALAETLNLSEDDWATLLIHMDADSKNLLSYIFEQGNLPYLEEKLLPLIKEKCKTTSAEVVTTLLGAVEPDNALTRFLSDTNVPDNKKYDVLKMLLNTISKDHAHAKDEHQRARVTALLINEAWLIQQAQSESQHSFLTELLREEGLANPHKQYVLMTLVETARSQNKPLAEALYQQLLNEVKVTPAETQQFKTRDLPLIINEGIRITHNPMFGNIHELHALNEEVMGLRAQISPLQQQLEGYIQDAAARTIQYRWKLAQLNGARQKVSELTSQLDENKRKHDEELGSLKGENLSVLNERQRAYDKEKDDLIRELDSMVEVEAKLKRDVGEQKNKLDTKDQEIRVLKQDLETLSVKLDRQQQQNVQLKASEAAFARERLEQEQTLKREQFEKDFMLGLVDIYQLGGISIAAKAMIETVGEREVSLNRQLERLEANLTAVEHEVVAQKQTVAELGQQRIDEELMHKKQLALARAALDQMATEKNALLSEHAAQVRDLERISNQKSAEYGEELANLSTGHKQRLEAAESAIEEANQKISNLEEEYQVTRQQLEEKLTSTQNELQKQQNAMAEISNELFASKEIQRRLEREKEQLEAGMDLSLAARQELSTLFQTQLTNLSQQIAQQQQLVEEKESDLAKYKRNLELRGEELQQANRQSEDLSRQIQEKETEFSQQLADSNQANQDQLASHQREMSLLLESLAAIDPEATQGWHRARGLGIDSVGAAGELGGRLSKLKEKWRVLEESLQASQGSNDELRVELAKQKKIFSEMELRNIKSDQLLADLQSKNEQLNRDAKSLSKEKEKLSAQLESLNNHFARLSVKQVSEFEELEQRERALVLEFHDAFFDSLRSMVEQDHLIMQQKMVAATQDEKLAQLDSTIQEEQAHISTLMQEQQKRERELLEVRAKFAQEQHQTTASEHTVRDLRSIVTRLEQDVAAGETIIREFRLEHQRDKSELENLRTHKTNLDRLLEQQTLKISEVTRDLENAQQQKVDLEAQLAEANIAVSAEKSTTRMTSEAMQSLMEAVELKQTTLMSIRDQLLDEYQTLTALFQQQNLELIAAKEEELTTRSELKSAQQERLHLQHQLEVEQRNLGEVNQANEQQKINISQLRERLSKSEAQEAEFRRNYDKKEKDYQTLSERFEQQQQDASALADAMALLQEKVSGLDNTLTVKTRALDDFESRTEAHQHEMEKLRTDIGRIQGRLYASIRKNETLEGDNKDLAQSVIVLKREAQKNKEKVQRLTDSIRKTDALLAHTKQNLTSKTREVDVLRTETERQKQHHQKAIEGLGADNQKGLKAANDAHESKMDEIRLQLDESVKAQALLQQTLDEQASALEAQRELVAQFAKRLSAAEKEKHELQKKLTDSNKLSAEDNKSFESQLADLTINLGEQAQQLNQTKGDLEKLSQHNQILRQQNGQLKDKNQALEDETKTLRGEIATLKNQLKQNSEKFSAMKQEMGPLKNERNQIKAKLERLQADMQHVQWLYRGEHTKAESYEKQLGEMSEQKKTLEAELRQQEKLLRGKASESQDLSNALKTALDNIEILQAEIRDSSDVSKQEREGYDKDLAASRRECEQLRNDMEGLSSENQALKYQVLKLSGEVTDLKNLSDTFHMQFAREKEESAAIESALRRENEHITAQLYQRREEYMEYIKLHSQFRDLRTKSTARHERSMRELRDELEQGRAKLHTTESELASRARKFEASRQELLDLQGKFDQIRQQESQLVAKSAQDGKVLSELRTEIARVKSSFGRVLRENSNLILTNEELRKNVADLEARNQKFQDENKSLRDRVGELSQQLANQTTELEALRKSPDEHRKEIDRLRTELERSQTHNQRLCEEVKGAAFVGEVDPTEKSRLDELINRQGEEIKRLRSQLARRRGTPKHAGRARKRALDLTAPSRDSDDSDSYADDEKTDDRVRRKGRTKDSKRDLKRKSRHQQHLASSSSEIGLFDRSDDESLTSRGSPPVSRRSAHTLTGSIIESPEETFDSGSELENGHDSKTRQGEIRGTGNITATSHDKSLASEGSKNASASSIINMRQNMSVSAKTEPQNKTVTSSSGSTNRGVSNSLQGGTTVTATTPALNASNNAHASNTASSGSVVRVPGQQRPFEHIRTPYYVFAEKQPISFDKLFSQRDSKVGDIAVKDYEKSKLNDLELNNLKQASGLMLFSPAGHQYRLSEQTTGQPKAYLSSDEANKKFPTELDSQKDQRLAVTIMNMIDNILAQGTTMVNVETDDPFVAGVAKGYLDSLSSNQEVDFEYNVTDYSEDPSKIDTVQRGVAAFDGIKDLWSGNSQKIFEERNRKNKPLNTEAYRQMVRNESSGALHPSEDSILEPCSRPNRGPKPAGDNDGN